MTQNDSENRIAVREMTALEGILPTLRQLYTEIGSPEKDMKYVLKLSDKAYEASQAILERMDDDSFMLRICLDNGMGDEPIVFVCGVQYLSASEDFDEDGKPRQ
jgi:hypothetical protein